MSLQERSDLVLSFAKVLFANGQATDQTVSATERLGRALGLRATIIPRWGELAIQTKDANAMRSAQIAERQHDGKAANGPRGDHKQDQHLD